MLIHHRIISAAVNSPDAPAIVQDSLNLTYGELLAWAEQLAELFVARLPPNARIALCLEKSPAAIAAMLAALLAGCTYVPLDPKSPMARKISILRDSQAAAIVIDSANGRDWEQHPRILSELALVIGPLDTAAAAHRAPLDPNKDRKPLFRSYRPVSDEDLAYILYTSGSTGVPKGVMITHGNAAGFVNWALTYFDLAYADRLAVHAPLHFDLPVFDIYVGLARGACIYPVTDTVARFPEALLQFLRTHSITVLYAVPSALIALLSRSTLLRSGLPSLRLLLYAGEVFHAAQLAKLMTALPGIKVFNLYGPIETNVVTAYQLEHAPAPDTRVPIGTPIADTHVFVIDTDGSIITTQGAEGEIAISGPTVSPGYLNSPELTASSRLMVKLNERTFPAYRTGDWGFWDETGILHFQGRRDDVIKVRGFRVDLCEVEATLSAHPDVTESAVVTIADLHYTNRLLGFVTPAPGCSPTALALVAWCRDRLPAYMIPERILIRELLPKTSTGKIARRALLAEEGLCDP
ncbi:MULTISPECIES: amino acid adenylation domain-containing protein [unclassified Bradyrhizobium]|uniref:amino acid adenylation domain-containing protein n=1 Tax=unclassified Bradyrhizobium TaxID=2631580 RepID=UPI00291622A1|nr:MULTISPECIES: amino acid adenylation domain-containing protein [unclassified Bradyrhizobium]